MMELVIFNLPDFAFLDGNCHEGDTLKDRDVVLHIRSASVVEFFNADNVNLNDNVIHADFDYKNIFGITEKKVCALHYSQTLSDPFDIKEHILKPAIEWFKKYSDWEDGHIVTEDLINYESENN